MISIDQADSVTCAVPVRANLTDFGGQLFAWSGLDKDSARWRSRASAR